MMEGIVRGGICCGFVYTQLYVFDIYPGPLKEC